MPSIRPLVLSAGVFASACGLAASFAPVARAEPVQGVLIIGPAAPTSARSAIPGVIPGGAGAQADPRFTNFNNWIRRSPTSNLWLVVATTNLTPGSVDQVLVIGSGLNIVGGAVAAREGITATTSGDLLNFSPSTLSTPRINDSGQWVSAFRLANAPGGGTGTALDERVVKWDGSSLITLLMGGTPIPESTGLTGQTYGGSFASATISNDGSVAFQATIAPTTGTAQDSVFGLSGASLVINLNTDVPSGQSGAPAAWSDVDSGGFTQSADGLHWLALGKVGFDTTVDRVVVVDGVVKLQKGTAITGSTFTSPVSTVTVAQMESSGDWFALGTNADGIRWVVRNGAVIAAQNQPIVPGSTELWETFQQAVGNNAGNFVVVGNTNAATLTDDVVVLNGQRVIARESDPVDTEADGTFSGSLFVHLIQDRGTLNNDGYFYFAARLKSTASATSGAGGSNNASLLRVRACPSDYNGSGTTTVQDIFDFLGAWFAGSMVADFDRSGTLAVQDIFDFLAAWFTTC